MESEGPSFQCGSDRLLRGHANIRGPWRRALFRLISVALAACSIASVSRIDLLADGPSPAPSVTSATPAIATSPRERWGVLFSHSLMTDDGIWQVLSGHVTLKFGVMDTIDVSYEVEHENVFKRHTEGAHGFWRPFAGSLYLAGSLTRRDDDPGGDMFELAPYVMWRLRPMPVARLLATTFAVGDGLSYTTHVPAREGGQHLKNFLTVEGTLGIPSHQDIALVLRVHHRCDAWGLFGAGGSTNAIGLGVRYLF